MPAAAVTPAPIVYLNVVAVKKLVVEFLYNLGPGSCRTVGCTSAYKLSPIFTGRLRE